MFVIALVVVVSGCAHSGLDQSLPSDTSSSSGSGLEIATFDVSDTAIGPGQTGIITVELVNYHEEEIDLEEVSIYNTGVLEVEKTGCNPSQLRPAREDYIPRMQCTWTVEVPEDAVENFDSKTIPVKLNLRYGSQLSNSKQPVKTHFYPLDEISRTNQVEKTFSNNEVALTIATERPIPFEGRTVTITARNAGNGRVDSNFEFEYFPEEVFEGCESEKEPVVDQQVEFTCDIAPQSKTQQTRNLIVSTSYKYVKSPTLDIEVVSTS